MIANPGFRWPSDWLLVRRTRGADSPLWHTSPPAADPNPFPPFRFWRLPWRR